MKLFFILACYIFSKSLPQSSVYDIQIEGIGGNTINLSAYQLKKIIVNEFDAQHPDIDQLQYLDSLQLANDNLVVIAVPADDFSGTVADADIVNLRDSLGLQLILTRPEATKKSAGGAQSALFRWLTDVNENGHFDNEVTEPGQLFIISGQGTLFSLLTKNTPHSVVIEAIDSQIDE